MAALSFFRGRLKLSDDSFPNHEQTQQTFKSSPHHRRTMQGTETGFCRCRGLRPTPDSVREKLFNWLGQDLTGMNVLDLFAGSGALGFEAASRNAKRAVLADNNRKTADMLRQNARALGLDKLEIFNTDGLTYLQRSSEKFDVVFLDPPFAWQGWEICLLL